MNIIIENVRSFSKRRNIPLKPLTILVGENSSGKSTFLSIIASVLNYGQFPVNTSFNQSPYSLGAFDTIATHKGGKYGRNETFSIGYSIGAKGTANFRKTVASYRSDHGDVVLRRFEASAKEGEFWIDVNHTSISGELTSATDGKHSEMGMTFSRQIEGTHFAQTPFALQVMNAFTEALEPPPKGNKGAGFTIDFDRAFRLIQAALIPPFPNAYSFPPIRSKPKRTYNFAGEDSVEGDHIPRVLARLLGEAADSVEGRRVLRALERFGAESGLLRGIGVKKLGKKETDPFQVQINLTGPAVNLTDVGYGVSQTLPIIVQSVLKPTIPVLLLQQPEVHLHPRQAALGSFFSELVAKDDRMIVVETHSDYLVDRVRQEVASGTISPERVQILFFDKPKLETEIYPIQIDSNGNIMGAPPQYRSFFMQEELKLLTRTEA